MKISKAFIALAIVLLLIILFALSKCGSPEPDVVKVDCEKESLAETMVNSVAGTRIEVSGECNENSPVVIDKNNIVIIGKGQTITGNGIDSVIKVEGAKNVIISGLTLTNGENGIFIDGKSTVVLNNINTSENSNNGIVIGGSEPGIPEFYELNSEEYIQKQKQENPVKLMLNEMNFSFIKQAVASVPVCTAVTNIIRGSDSEVEIDAKTNVFCEVVTANNNVIGVLVAQDSTLEVYGHLVMQNNEIGMVVSSSTVNVFKTGIVDEGEVNNSESGVGLVNEADIKIHKGGTFTFVEDERIVCLDDKTFNVDEDSPRVLTCAW